MLRVEGINTYYGKSHILNDVSLKVETGGLVSLVGRNGVGKTTTLKSIIGIAPPSSGRITFKNDDINGLPSYVIAGKGIAYVPEDRRIFPELTVLENLLVGMLLKGYNTQKRAQNIEQMLTYFPSLEARLEQKGDTLSGGEQQMLAFARALIVEPELLLLDEPMEGLMPILVLSLGDVLMRLKDERNMAILMVEQNTEVVLRVSDTIYIMEKGSIRYQGGADELRKNETVLKKYLGV